jgi:hypothetical protein
VAEIFPEQFQSFTNTLKNHLLINYFAQIHLSCLPKGKQKKNRHIQAKMSQKEATRAMLVSGLRAGRT